MNLQLVERIANAVLYEGYMLYPYTASSVKNRQRWNFGVLYPPAFEAGEMQTECLALTGESTVLDVRVRFLQCSAEDDTVSHDTTEREIGPVGGSLADLTAEAARIPFRFAGSETVEGALEIAAARVSVPDNAGLFRIAVQIRNTTPFEAGSRADALFRSMLSTHTILTLRGGEFVSLIDPPPEYREAARGCCNTGTWPVLAGAEGDRDTMLSSPIILYDYPQVAPESAGDLFDATEIEEILTLRILTLSDVEKAEIREGNQRSRQILERSESLPPEQLMKMHGALRSLGRVPGQVRR